MTDPDKLRLERELAHPGTYGEAKVRHREWNLAEYRENYDAVIQRVRDTRHRTDAEIDGLRADLEVMNDRLARAVDLIQRIDFFVIAANQTPTRDELLQEMDEFIASVEGEEQP